METPESSKRMDLYTLLKLDRTATEEDIHRAYKALSATFHPDKLPPATPPEDKELIQQVFLDFKRARDVLIDPVLRLTYNLYGEEGVELLRRIQQQRREYQKRREAPRQNGEGGDEDDADDDEDEMEESIYERVEELLTVNSNPMAAKQELQKFMQQHDYHSSLTDQNQVQLACSIDFPPVIDLKELYFTGRDYLQLAKQNISAQARQAPPEERKYYQHRFQQEQALVDYQINYIRESQKGSVGFTLSSLQPRSVKNITGDKVQPKWSMAIGTSTDRIYPSVDEIAKMVKKDTGERRHPASAFLNAVYQPVPDSQVNFTANLSNDQAHQFVLGSARNFSNRSSYRYSLTFLSKSPMDTNMILNLKSFRHLKDIGLLSGGFSFGANGKFLQWNAKWEAVNGDENVHKTSAKVAVGMMQGNSLELSYKLKSRKKIWLDDYILLPKSLGATTTLGQFPKVEASATQEITTLASHPKLSFGFEHDISLGCWNWVWELSVHNSTFRVPIPVFHLGTVTNPIAYYQQRFFYGLYSLTLQSLVADILQDEDDQERSSSIGKDEEEALETKSIRMGTKTKVDALHQLALMQSVAERQHYLEEQSQGLVIRHAVYFYEDRSGREPQFASMDATVQLRFWVSNSTLMLPAIPKSSLLGFYDLRTEIKDQPLQPQKWNWRIWKQWQSRSSTAESIPSVPMLKIRYSYKEYVYEKVIADDEPVTLPCRDARLLGHADVLQ